MHSYNVRGISFILALAVAGIACGGDSPPDDDGITNTEPVPGFVAGVVRDASGNGVSGAALELSDGSDMFMETSASDGSYLFSQIVAGSWTLSITPPGCYLLADDQEGSVSVDVAEGDTATANFDLTAPPPPADTGAIEVLVRADGAPRDGVQAAASTTDCVKAEGTTAANGRVLLEDLGVGEYSVEITVPSGFALAQGESNPKSAAVAADATTDISFSLVTATSSVDTVDVHLTSNYTFSPENVTISPGDFIRWIDDSDQITHTTTSDDGIWDETMSDGETFIREFSNAGSFPYYCQPHGGPGGQGMSGTITVE